jgi:hypothetical protein
LHFASRSKFSGQRKTQDLTLILRSAWDEAQRFGVTMPPEVPMITQERAYTSPIWYTP